MVSVSTRRLFRWDEDYGDERPGDGDIIELESGLTILIKDSMIEDGILVINEAEILYVNFRLTPPGKAAEFRIVSRPGYRTDL